MSNTLVSQFRSLQPNDPRTDDELTKIFGQANEVDGRYNKFTDFVEDYARLKQPASEDAFAYDLPESVAGEFGKALRAGGQSLKQSATGLGALIASHGGWDSLSKKLLTSYQQQVEAGAENAPKIPNIEDIKSPSDLAFYLAAKAGGLAPVLGEAMVVGAAGAAAGSAVAPGPGTVAGAGAGLVESFLGRQAAKSILKLSVEKMVERFGIKRAAAVALRDQLEGVAAKKVAGEALDAGVKKLLAGEAKAIASKMGATGANMINFYGLGAGPMYGQLSNTEGVTDADAKVGSAIAGAGSAAGVLLPAYITSRLFPGVGSEVAATYVKRLAADAAKEIPAAAAGNGMMAIASIAAEKYADPKRRDEGWTDDDTSRLLNELAVGGMLGAVTSPLTALKGPKRFDPAVEQHFKDVPPERRAQIEALKGRLMAGSPSEVDISAERSLSPGERAYYAVAEALPLQKQTAEQANQPPPPATTKLPVEEIQAAKPPAATAAATTAAASDLQLAQESSDSLVKRTAVGAERDAAFTTRRQAAVRVASTATSGDVLVMDDGTRHVLTSIGDGANAKGEYLAHLEGGDPNNAAIIDVGVEIQRGGKIEKKSGAKVPPENKGDGSVSVPLMVTKEMNQALADLGYTEQDRASLRPEEAQSIIAENLKKPSDLRAASVAPMQTVDTTAVDAAKSRVAAAAAKTEPNPTEAQKEAGNYAKGKVDIQGLPISIENPKGSTRTGTGSDGKPWSVELPAHYGYIRGTVGRDKDHIDVYIGENPTAGTVFVVDQINPKTGKFDEHKNMLGFNTREEALAAYDSAFSDGSGPRRRGAVTEMPMPEFKMWLEKGDTKKALSYKESNPKTAADLAAMTADEFNAYRKGLGVNQTADQRRLAEAGTAELESLGKASADKAKALLDEAAAESDPVKMAAAFSEQQRSQFFMEAAGKSGNAETLAKVEVAKPVEAPVVEAPKPAAPVVEPTPGPVEVPSQPKYKEPEAKSPTEKPKVQSATLKKIDAALEKKADKINDIRARMEALKKSKPIPEIKKPTGESGFVINPADFKLLDPEYLALVAEMSKEVIASGALKFAHYAVKMKEHIGDIIGDLTDSVIMHAYEAARTELKKTDRETHNKLTPLDSMGDAIIKLESKKAKDAKVYHADYRIRPTDVDVERAGTVDKSARGSKTGEKVVEPSYFVPKERTEAKLSERLLSQSSPPDVVNGEHPNNTLTYRLAAVLDNETGNVHLVSVWKNNGVANLTKFVSGMGAKKSVTLSELLDAKTSEKEPRFQVIASLKTNDLSEYYHQVYTNRKAFRDQFSIDVDTQQKRVASAGRIEEQKMQSAGIEQGAAAKAAREEQIAGAAKEGVDLADKSTPESTTAIGDQNKPNIREGENMGQAAEEDVAPLDPHAPIATTDKATRINLDNNEVDVLRKELPGFDTYDELADRIYSNDPPLSDALYEAIEKAVAQDPHFISRIFHHGLEATIKDHVNANDNARAGKPVEQSAVAPKAADSEGAPVGGGERGRVPASQSEPVRQDRPGEVNEPTGEQGNAVTDPNAGAGEGVDWAENFGPVKMGMIAGQPYVLSNRNKGFFIKSNGKWYDKTLRARNDDGTPATLQDIVANGMVSETPPNVAEYLDSITKDLHDALPPSNEGGLAFTTNEKSTQPVQADQLQPQEQAAATERFIEAARQAGINVKGVKAEAVREAAKALGVSEDRLIGSAATDATSRTIVHVLSDVSGKPVVSPRAMLHEVAHIVAHDEHPKVLEGLLKATSKLSDEALGVDLSPDPRIRASDPAKLGSVKLQKERLIEATALKLQAEGFDPVQAKSISQKFVRQMEDFYYRSVMAVQKLLRQPENPELARRYFENRVRQLLAGDRVTSYLDFVNARALNVAERWNREFDNGNVIGERVSPDGRIEYDRASDLESSGARFNSDQLEFTAADPSNPDKLRIALEQRVSVLNHLTDTIGTASKAVTEQAKAVKMTPEKYLRRILRIDDPADAKAELGLQRVTGGEEPGFDPSKKLEDFKSPALLGQNIRAGYKNAERLLAKAGSKIIQNTDDVARWSKKRDALVKQLEGAKERVQELKDIKKDTSVSVPGVDKLLAKAEVKAENIGRRVSAAKRRIERKEMDNKALAAVMPAFEAEKTRLGSKQRIGVEVTFGDGMVYNVPEHPGMNSKEIVELGKDGKVVTAKTLVLDRDAKVVDPKGLEADIRKMEAFLSHREAQARAGNENALDDVYVGIKKQHDEIVANKEFTLRLMPAHRFLFGLTLSATGRRLRDAFGSYGARIERRLNTYTSLMEAMHPAIENFGRVSTQLEDALLKMVPGKFSHETMRQDVIYKAIETIENATDLAELHAGDRKAMDKAIFARVKANILANPALKDIHPIINQFMPALEKAIRHKYEADQYLHKQVREGGGIAKELGLDVQDEALKAIDPATGQRQTASRAPVEVGPYTFQKRFSQRGRGVAKALGGSGWAGFKQALEKFSNPETMEIGRAELLKLTNHPEYGPQVRQDFVEALARMDERSPFQEPKAEEDLTRSTVSPELMAEALEKSEFADNGDLVKLAEAVHELHGGAGDVNAYTAEFLGTLGKIYAGIMAKMGEMDIDPTAPHGIEGMTPPAMIDARVVRHLPGDWFDYHSYDQKDMFNQVQRIASELAFRRGQAGLMKEFKDLGKVVGESKTKVDAVRRELQIAGIPKPTSKQVKDALVKRFGIEKADTLMRHEKNARFIGSATEELSDFFRKDNSPDGTLNAVARGAHAIGALMVNQPASAIRQTEQLFAPFLKYGLSRETVASSGHALKSFASEAIASFAQAFGVRLMDSAEDHRLYVDLGQKDPTVIKSWHDAFDRLEGESATSHFIRGFNDLVGFGVNRVGPSAEHTVLRPFQPFTTSAMVIDKALTSYTWNMAKRYASKGVEFYKANIDKLNDPDFKLDGKAIGLTGASLDSFRRFNDSMERWGVNYDEMVRDAMKRGDGTLMSREEAMRLYSLGVAEISSESNLSTMPLGAYNNSLLKVISPLLGWPFRRMMDVLSVGRTPEGKNELAFLARGLAGLAVLATGGLAVSALTNQYQETFLGKKSNLRPVAGAPDPEQMALGVFENLARAGTLGLLGEGLNGIVNVGVGGDNRSILSLDQRVLALSSAMNIQRAISSWIHQGEADYTHVIRPLASSLGGVGALQYMQLANRALGFDNAESRMTARVSAQNWLRVVGRTLDMDVRTPSGSFSSPNTLTPHITRMELAAYSNDAGDFRDAYTSAVQAAKSAGIEDPVGHVKRAFSSRNPLKSVFRTSITEREYAKLLATMPESGRRDVEDAVRHFNGFSEQIGASAFDGKTDSKPIRYSPTSLRAYAAEAIGK